jgi:hypothetical protein
LVEGIVPMSNLALAGAVGLLLGAQADFSGLARPHPQLSPLSQLAEVKAPNNPIGTCWMEEDGTVVLDLRRTADGINISMRPQRFARTHPRYEEVLRHVGPLRPGEVKLVEPWPD